MKKLFVFLLILSTLLLFGCASNDFDLFDFFKRENKEKTEITVEEEFFNEEEIEEPEEYEEEIYIMIKKSGYRNFVVLLPEMNIDNIFVKFAYKCDNEVIDCNVTYDVFCVNNGSEINISVNNIPEDFNDGVLQFCLEIPLDESDKIELDSEFNVSFVDGDIVVKM